MKRTKARALPGPPDPRCDPYRPAEREGDGVRFLPRSKSAPSDVSIKHYDTSPPRRVAPGTNQAASA